MIHLKPIDQKHLSQLYPIVMREDIQATGLTLEGYTMLMSKREGWTIWADETIIGAITLSDFVPLLSVLLHVTVDRAYRGRWETRKILRYFFNYVFEELEVKRISAYSIPEKNEAAKVGLLRLGFTKEGLTRCAILTNCGQYLDIETFGMLREECPWLLPDRLLLDWMRKNHVAK